jgi:selenide,water dikinase
VGRYAMPSTQVLATVDVVFPMVLKPEDFGTIAAIHALGDIHAALGRPHMALSIVGIPRGLSPSSEEIVGMLAAASDTLEQEGVSLVGGHTLAKQAELFLGFAILGTAPASEGRCRDCRAGDPILLTKHLGSGTATALWKADDKHNRDFQDVLADMKVSSAQCAEILFKLGIVHCTDVTGYGLINHLHLLLNRLGLAADISLENLPIYKSIRALAGAILPTTGQYYPNFEHAEQFSNAREFCDDWRMLPAVDSQVAGGLLFACPIELTEVLVESLSLAAVEASVIGHCRDGQPGAIIISR